MTYSPAQGLDAPSPALRRLRYLLVILWGGCPPLHSDFAQRMAQALSRHPESVLHTINLAGNQLEDRGTPWGESKPTQDVV